MNDFKFKKIERGNYQLHIGDCPVDVVLQAEHGDSRISSSEIIVNGNYCARAGYLNDAKEIVEDFFKAFNQWFPVECYCHRFRLRKTTTTKMNQILAKQKTAAVFPFSIVVAPFPNFV